MQFMDMVVPNQVIPIGLCYWSFFFALYLSEIIVNITGISVTVTINSKIFPCSLESKSKRTIWTYVKNNAQTNEKTREFVTNFVMLPCTKGFNSETRRSPNFRIANNERFTYGDKNETTTTNKMKGISII